MIKTVITVMLVAILVTVILLAAFIAKAWWVSLKQPPAYVTISVKYYVCRNKKALHGGIFGKGPTKRLFPENARQWCWRWEWEEIGAEQFKRLATEWYGINWSEEPDWWRSTERL